MKSISRLRFGLSFNHFYVLPKLVEGMSIFENTLNFRVELQFVPLYLLLVLMVRWEHSNLLLISSDRPTTNTTGKKCACCYVICYKNRKQDMGISINNWNFLNIGGYSIEIIIEIYFTEIYSWWIKNSTQVRHTNSLNNKKGGKV